MSAKVSCTVLRGGESREAQTLPDNDILKVSPNASFTVTQVGENIAICEATNGGLGEAEALRDRNNWGNATNTEPAFIAYVGCKKEEVAGYVKTFNTFYRCEWCEVRKPKYLKDFEAEIKIRGMQRESDQNAFGLNYLVESESAKHIGCNEEEYNYYTTGVMQRW